MLSNLRCYYGPISLITRKTATGQQANDPAARIHPVVEIRGALHQTTQPVDR
jgi:hypothetical protein